MRRQRSSCREHTDERLMRAGVPRPTRGTPARAVGDEKDGHMKRVVRVGLAMTALSIGVAAQASSAFASQPPGQRGYEGQPGNQGGVGGNGLLGYEGQPGNRGG